MSDYLGLLSARQLGTQAMVQPRLASRFEPEVNGFAAHVNAPDEHLRDDAPEESEEVIESSARPNPRKSISRGVPRLQAQAMTDSTSDLLEPEPSRPMPETRVVRHLVTPIAHQPQASEPGVLKVKTVSVLMPTPAPRAERNETANGANLEPIARTAQPTLEPDAPERRPSPQTAIEPVTSQITHSEHRIETRIEREQQHTIRTLEPTSFTPKPVQHLEPRLAADPEPIAQQHTQAVQRTVRITIGRLEVRLQNPTAAAPVRAAKTANVMNLDEYLSRRDGRSR
jgi:hypothetical protein